MARSYPAQAIEAIVERLPAKGQALAAGSMPVVFPALQATAITPPTAAAIASAISSGVGVPKANLVTGGAGAEVVIAIPTGVKFIDFLLSLPAYVAADANSAADSFDTNQGVPYQPNLNFRLPCFGATYLHLEGASSAIHTMQYNEVS